MATTGIAQRNIELARKGYRAFNDKDVEAVTSLFAEDILWHGGPRGPLAGDHKGKAAVMDLFMKFGQLTEGSYTAELHDVLATEEHTVVLGISTMSRKGTDYKDKFVDVLHPDADGKVTEFWRFSEDQAALLEFLES